MANKKVTLYQKGRTGKIKVLEFWTDGPKFYTRWGQLDGKQQETMKVCKPMNVGKANELSAEEQAVAEMEAKIVIKRKEGYDDHKPAAHITTVQATIDLDNIPESFCPNKPISKAPDKLVNDRNTYGQRKHDGHCYFFVKGKTVSKIYSRRMEDRTDVLNNIPIFEKTMKLIPRGSFVMCEIVYEEATSKKQKPRFVAQVVAKKDADEALARYIELSKEGEYRAIPFDILFHDYTFVGDTDYLERHKLLINMELNPPGVYKDWRKLRAQAEHDGWEGFILRTPGEKSYISYSMDGEAHRAGSWKYKFLKTDDYFVTEWLMGKSGKHAKFYAKFRVAQYDESGKIIDRGYVGPGKLTHEELEQLTLDINSGKVKKNFVVEAEYQEIQDSGKLQFGIIQRIRTDKMAKECIAE
jgi:hypothetical protein